MAHGHLEKVHGHSKKGHKLCGKGPVFRKNTHGHSEKAHGICRKGLPSILKQASGPQEVTKVGRWHQPTIQKRLQKLYLTQMRYKGVSANSACKTMNQKHGSKSFPARKESKALLND